jgi:hypothetical protein
MQSLASSIERDMSTDKRVKSPKELKKNQSYQLGELPAGVLFRYKRQLFKTVVQPKFNTAAMNILHDVEAEVYNKDLQKIQSIPFDRVVEVV